MLPTGNNALVAQRHHQETKVITKLIFLEAMNT